MMRGDMIRCPVCGADYPEDRQDCPRCYRQRLWDSAYKKDLIKTKCSPRIAVDVNNNYPDTLENASAVALKIQENKSKGVGAFLCGPVGSGKTVTAFYIMMELARLDYVNNNILFHGNELVFATMNDILMAIRNSFSPTAEVKEKDVVSLYSDAKVLLVDDFGLDKVTDWSFQMIYAIINHRYENLLPTIFTSNLTLEEIAEKLCDDRIPSRVFAMTKGSQYHLKGLDKRINKNG